MTVPSTAESSPAAASVTPTADTRRALARVGHRAGTDAFFDRLRRDGVENLDYAAENLADYRAEAATDRLAALVSSRTPLLFADDRESLRLYVMNRSLARVYQDAGDVAAAMRPQVVRVHGAAKIDRIDAALRRGFRAGQQQARMLSQPPQPVHGPRASLRSTTTGTSPAAPGPR